MISAMRTVDVSIPPAPYTVAVGDGLLARVGATARDLALGDRCALVTDSHVGPLHGEAVRASLDEAGIGVVPVEVPAGEASKSLGTAGGICGQMAAAGLDRGSFVVALGGGVVGDLAGFAAAIHYRGVPCLQVPTTIVAQVDSSVGGKTGVNSAEGKNLIGAFHQPAAVLADTSTLATLPGPVYREGFAEVIKHAAIRDPGMLDDLLARDPEDRCGLDDLIARNVAIKAAVVAADERETSGRRAWLNFGHTLGHAIEAEAGYGRLLHGEAIALGLRAALFLSVRKRGLDHGFAARVLDTLRHFGLPLTLPPSLATDALLHRASRDKKFTGGTVRFVLLRAPGDPELGDDVTVADMADALDDLRTPVAGG